jgi:hypothetical protein
MPQSSGKQFGTDKISRLLMKSVGIKTPTDLSLSILQLPTYRNIWIQNLKEKKRIIFTYFLSLFTFVFYNNIN